MIYEINSTSGPLPNCVDQTVVPQYSFQFAFSLSMLNWQQIDKCSHYRGDPWLQIQICQDW